MKILVTYASRHGSTQGIAERVGGALEKRGLEVAVLPVAEAGDPVGYDAFVIGSAAYAFHWMKEATSYVRRHRSFLAEKPVWLFSSGPLGTDAVDAKGRDQRVASAPKEFAEFAGEIHPRDERVFFGAWDPEAKPIGMMEKLMHMMPAAADALPAGDFRDWDDIDAWADGIATELTRSGHLVA
jgi:menaquinone-dependent protoporphyrinogen oxidase